MVLELELCEDSFVEEEDRVDEECVVGSDCWTDDDNAGVEDGTVECDVCLAVNVDHTEWFAGTSVVVLRLLVENIAL